MVHWAWLIVVGSFFLSAGAVWGYGRAKRFDCWVVAKYAPFHRCQWLISLMTGKPEHEIDREDYCTSEEMLNQ